MSRRAVHAFLHVISNNSSAWRRKYPSSIRACDCPVRIQWRMVSERLPRKHHSSIADLAITQLLSEMTTSSDFHALPEDNFSFNGSLVSSLSFSASAAAERCLREDEAFLLENSTCVSAEGIKMQLRLITPDNPIYRYTEEDLVRSKLRFLPFWGFLWPGGFALTKYIELNPGLFSGGLVVDLGCGCGSAGVAASAAGAVATVCNDIDPLAVIAAAHNIDINQNLLGNDTRNPRGSIGSTEYYFTTKDFISGGPEALTGYLSDNVNNLKSIDATRRYLLVGDMLYDDDIGESVLRLAQTLRLAGWQVLVGDPGRHFATSRSEELGPVEAEYDLPPALLDQNNGLNRTVVRRMRSVRCTQQHRG